jgi:ubiquinone biosynthesis protein
MFLEWDHLMRTLPGDVGDILDRVKRGKFRFYLEHRRLETSIALLVEGLVTSALFLGASLMLCFKLPPAPFFDLSIPGTLGLLVSLFLVWRLFRATKKSRSEP